MSDLVQVAVCGAHMSGLPLNQQLINLDGKLVQETTTSPDYKLFYLSEFKPTRPGMVRVKSGGSRIALEVWELKLEKYGALVAAIPAPLGIGRIELVDGVWVQGFLCENYATEHAKDISSYGGWRSFLTSDAYPSGI